MTDRQVVVARLDAALARLYPGCQAQWVEQVGSTNTELAARARRSGFVPTLLVADEQTAGRGRFGRRWNSVRGASLMFSLALPVARADWSGLSLAIGVAVVEALRAHHGVDPRRAADVGLKWPNDLLLSGGPGGARKLGGILVESIASAGGGRVAVVGLGLNLLPTAGGGADIERAASLSEFVRSGFTEGGVEQWLTTLAPVVAETVASFDLSGFSSFVSRYADCDLLLGRRVMTWQGGDRQEGGIARGVDDQGALLIETASGVTVIHGGEVSVRLDGDASVPASPAYGEAFR